MPWTKPTSPTRPAASRSSPGANTGIGFETARVLAERGAEVVLACRDAGKGEAAARRIRDGAPAASVAFAPLDLADLDAVAAFADRFAATHPRLDLLINNAGVMVPPAGRTAQGFELQFGVNHLGHFALTGRLLPRLAATPGARVVNVASLAHRIGRIAFEDLNFDLGYEPWPAYGQSKLANLLFTLGLQARLEAAGMDVLAVAAHPGWTGTDLQRNSPVAKLMGPLLAMRPAQGALPTLRAAVDADARPADYFGPSGFQELRGHPVRVGRTRAALDVPVSKRLWDESEMLTGVYYDFGRAA